MSGYGLTYRPSEHSVVPAISFREAPDGGFDAGESQQRARTVASTCRLREMATAAAVPAPGDSGGPVFLGGFTSNLIVGVTSFGLNALCRGTDFAYRIDRPEVLAWINSIN